LIGGYKNLIEKITKEMFAESLKTKFRLNVEASDPIELELVQLSEGASLLRYEQFALLFDGPPSPFLPQMIYHVEHEKLGEFDLFLVPVGKHQNGFQYEAAFNRSLEGN
jgi:hypothetical protein